MVITDADLGEVDRVKLQLAASFDMKDLGDFHYFLGIEVIRTLEGILISQRHYVVVPFGSGSLRESGGNRRGYGLGERRIPNKASKE